jgi:hypothetical protein
LIFREGSFLWRKQIEHTVFEEKGKEFRLRTKFFKTLKQHPSFSFGRCKQRNEEEERKSQIKGRKFQSRPSVETLRHLQNTFLIFEFFAPNSSYFVSVFSLILLTERLGREEHPE